MIDYKETCTITDSGPKLILEATADWGDFMCFKYPTSCSNCCVGWRLRCSVDKDVKKESQDSRPENCPLGLLVATVKN